MKKQVKGKKGILICFCIIVMSVLFFIIYQENAVSFTETTTSFFDGTSTEAEVENQNGAYYKITCKTEILAQDNCIDIPEITRIVEPPNNAASYVAENYEWETAGCFWDSGKANEIVRH